MTQDVIVNVGVQLQHVERTSFTAHCSQSFISHRSHNSAGTTKDIRTRFLKRSFYLVRLRGLLRYYLSIIRSKYSNHNWDKDGIAGQQFLLVFSERELTFMFAICCRPSVCRLSVTFVRHTQAVHIFRNISTPLGTLAIHWQPLKILRRSSKGNPSAGGVKHKRGSQVSRFRTYRLLYLGNGAR